MAWLALVPLTQLGPCLDPRGWQLLAAGGVAFIAGVGLYFHGARRDRPGGAMPGGARAVFSAW